MPKGKKKSKSKKIEKKSKNGRKKQSPTAELLENKKGIKLENVRSESKDVTKNELEKTIQATIKKLKPISDNKKILKKDLQSAIKETIENLVPVSEDTIKHTLERQDLKTEIRDVKANLQKTPKSSKRVLKKDLQSAITDVIASLETVSDAEKRHSLSKSDLETAISDAISSLEPVAETEIKHVLQKQDLKSEIRDTKTKLTKVSTDEKRHSLDKKDLQTTIRDTKTALKQVSDSEKRHSLEKKDLKSEIIDRKSQLKAVPEEVRRPQLSSKQLRTAIKDARIKLQPVSEEKQKINTGSLGAAIKEEGEKIKRDLLPIPGDVEIYEVRDIEHIQEYCADKTDFSNLLKHMNSNEMKPAIRFTINARTQFNKIEFYNEKKPISVDNLIAGGDLVQFGQAYRFLLKYGYIKINNPYTLLLSDNQWYVWHLKDEIDLTFVDIAYARNSSVREVRTIYQNAEIRINQILDFVVEGDHYQLVAAHAMKRKGILIQTIGDTIIEPEIKDYTSEEALLEELRASTEVEKQVEVPRIWVIKSGYKRETFLGGKYLWKEWLGKLKNDSLLLMENDSLPTETTYLDEALGFGANITPDIDENFEKLISLFKKVPDELIKIGDAAYFIGNIDSLYASQYWNINSFIQNDSIHNWREKFLQLAIKAYEQALTTFTLENYPLEFARSQNDLGNFYASLSELENTAENCKKAITAYKEALEVYSAELFKIEYSQVHYNLAQAYQTLSEYEDQAINCQFAILSYKEAIRGRDLTSYPFEFATTLVNQGIAYQTLAKIVDKGLYSTFAIDSYNGALRANSLTKMPLETAMIYNNIGISYKILAEEQEKTHNCKQALLILNDALLTRNQAQYPFEYAITTTILGDVYAIQALEEADEELKNKAIVSYDKSTKIFIKKYEDFYKEVVRRKQNLEESFSQ